MKHSRSHRRNQARRGSATLVATSAVLAMGSIASLIIVVGLRHSAEVGAAVDQNRAFFAAQAGANLALSSLTAEEVGPIGSPERPEAFSGASFWVEIEEPEEGRFVVLSHGRAGLQRKTLEVVAEAESGGPFFNGIFAGNRSGDPNYLLKLGGKGAQGDHVEGNLYSGGGVKLADDAMVDGLIRAQGSVSGKTVDVETGKKEPIPDFAAANYAATADVKVAQQFASARYLLNAAGGQAWQVSEDDPAHIFRKNPSDRTSDTLLTAKDDYFLEDPYERPHLDANKDGSDPYHVTFTGVGGEKGASSNQKVFYIDGNLWLHNKKSYSLKLDNGGAPSGLQVTFVVSGNIYIADNVFYTDAAKDGVAFIALQDPEEADSGNIYFGDPVFGTLKTMNGFMYAENNFYDNNLDASGSTTVELNGNMTAGNQVLINRDYVTRSRRGVKVIAHTRLGVRFDDRIATGELVLPGLPHAIVAGGGALTVLSWREAARE